MVRPRRDQAVFERCPSPGGIHRLAEGDDERGRLKADAMPLHADDHRGQVQLERTNIRGSTLRSINTSLIGRDSSDREHGVDRGLPGRRA